MHHATATGDGTAPPADAATAREAAFWRRYFTVYDTLTEAMPYQRMIARHVELLAPAAGERVLDAGTGTGNIAAALASAGAEVVGIDFCEPALEICRRKMPEGDFRFGDLTRRLDLPDGSFSKVASCNVLYTLDPVGQRTAVAELYRVLAPGGTAAVTVFGKGFRALAVYREAIRANAVERGLADTLARGLRYSLATLKIFYYVARIRRRRAAGAYTFFSRVGLWELLAGAGFEVVSIEAVLAGQCLLALARKADEPAGRAASDPTDRNAPARRREAPATGRED